MPKLDFFLCLLAFIMSVSCSNVDVKEFDNQAYTKNKFEDKNLQKIYQLQNDRNTKELLVWLEHSNPEYREASTLAFASIQDTSALKKLIELLEKDESIRVRMAAAFSIGQTNDSIFEIQLLKLADIENSEKVSDNIFEAIGKCGTRKGHDLLFDILQHISDKKRITGILLGMSRFSIRGISSDSAIAKVVDIISDEKQLKENQYHASIYLIRLKGADLTKHAGKLIQAFDQSDDVYTKMNIVLALSKAQNKESLSFLSDILKSEKNAMFKINALRSLSNFQYSEVGKLMQNSLNDTNVNVAIQASEYFLSKGIKQDAALYFNKAKTIVNWRVRTNLFQAAIKLSSQKSEMAKYIISEYEKSKNIYEKANLLRALGGDFTSFKFICNEIKETKDIPISTAGMEALTEMRRSDDFTIYSAKLKLTGKGDFANDFAQFFKETILSGDVAKVGIAADLIRDPELDFRQQYQNSYFLNQALNNCKLPSEIETYRELQKTISYINGTEYVEQKNVPKTKIDWDYISKIPYNQKVEINTNKGKIEIELYVNDSPVSVANFLKLISEGYFNNKHIHRVVPNFVIQDGCPRGDGWGGPDYTICSEFVMNYFTEGSLGMASAGKDTESSQWFITHCPTPHLDGRYTNFGKVIKGMDVVHKLEVGDEIIGMEIIK